MNTMWTRAATAACGRLRAAIISLVFGLLPMMSVWAQESGTSGGERFDPPAPTVCSDIEIPPADQLPPGGHWWNPKRYGVGWQTVYQDEGGVRKLAVYWYTYTSQNRPIWYFSDFAEITGGLWSAPLRKRNSSGTDQLIGHISMRTIPNHPERIGLRWQRNDGGISDTQEECVLDILRTEAIDAVGTHDRNVNSTYGGVWQQSSGGNHRTLNIAINNSASGADVELLVPLLYDNAGQPVWLWAQEPNGLGTGLVNGTFTHKVHYPKSTFAPNAECMGKACVVHHVLGSQDTVSRTFQNPTNGQARIRIGPSENGAFTVQGHSLRGWWAPISGSASIAIEKLWPHNVIEVNTYECDVQVGQSTCPIQVSWGLWPTQTTSIWRRNLATCATDTACLQLITTTSSSGQTTQALPAWSRLR